MSSVPAVDSEFVFAFFKTSPIAVSFLFDTELSRVSFNFFSPSDADNIAFTSSGVFKIASIFRSLKSCNWVDALVNAFSRVCTVLNFEEHMQRR